MNSSICCCIPFPKVLAGLADTAGMNKTQATQILESSDQDAETIIAAQFGEYDDDNGVHRHAHQAVFESLVKARAPGYTHIDLLAIIEPPFEQLRPSRLH
ncbi:hypothetical protein [Caballeronia sp. LZ043]|uniref:hypothetical protein n=1 Tax=Caballeronia sp. LZ043 TaxID=3038569 RepID=UPI002862FBC6|nr:hypothetical protein [Caballeronia sp. LZ043]MDR5821954.1 hypothetical protein [Caballeronia sp. LZ043]